MTWLGYLTLLPLFVGSHLAMYFHGKSHGIRWCMNMRHIREALSDGCTGGARAAAENGGDPR